MIKATILNISVMVSFTASSSSLSQRYSSSSSSLFSWFPVFASQGSCKILSHLRRNKNTDVSFFKCSKTLELFSFILWESPCDNIQRRTKIDWNRILFNSDSCQWRFNKKQNLAMKEECVAKTWKTWIISVRNVIKWCIWNVKLNTREKKIYKLLLNWWCDVAEFDTMFCNQHLQKRHFKCSFCLIIIIIREW